MLKINDSSFNHVRIDRGIAGLYNQSTDDGVPIEVALSGAMLIREPALCWKYLKDLGKAAQTAEPNEGHRILAKWEERFDRFLILTQNIDGFHGQAGSKHVIEMHGTVDALECTVCHWRDTEPLPNVDELPPVPTCKSCGAVARPPVVLFGENLQDHNVLKYQGEIESGPSFDVILSIGTTSVFPYIAG